AVAIFALYPSKLGFGPEDEAIKLVSLIREGHQRAMSQRQTMRLRVDQNAGQMQLIDEGTIPIGDERVIRDVQINQNVRMDPPTAGGAPLGPPGTPFNYPVALFQNGVWEALFTADGAMTDATAAPAPLSATFFFWPVTDSRDPFGAPTLRKPTDARAVTVFGPSGSVRYWRHDGNQFVSESR
ncbi:MAG TPA: hypothetical protein VFV34_13475, partial [Blastocatellia bacterium]|nr:hypothetical protein [Blastocatellia bacterium]